MAQTTARPSSGSLLTTPLLGLLWRSPSLGGPGQGRREPGANTGSTSNELCDLSSLCLHSLIHPLSQSLLRACLCIQELPVYRVKSLRNKMTGRIPRSCILPSLGFYLPAPTAGSAGSGKSLNMQTGVSALVRTAPVCPFLPLSSRAAEKKAGIRPQSACACWCGSSGPTLLPAG